MPIETTTLGCSELRVSRLGMGGCPLGGHGWGADFDERDAKNAVRRALELGVTFFDTADVYGLGRSEQLLSEALDRQRQSVAIASKFGVAWDNQGRTWKDISPRRVRTALEGSLRRLRVERIDLYYIHWPDGVTPLSDVLEELDRCREAGKVRAIGLSNFSGDDLAAAASQTSIAALQVEYSLANRAAGALALRGAQLGVPIIAWGSLAQGLLTGKYDATTRFDDGDRRSRYANFQGAKMTANLRLLAVLRDVAAACGKTPAQTALRWLLDAPGVGCALFGAKRPAQVEENLGALGWKLSPEAFDRLAMAGAASISTLDEIAA